MMEHGWPCKIYAHINQLISTISIAFIYNIHLCPVICQAGQIIPASDRGNKPVPHEIIPCFSIHFIYLYHICPSAPVAAIMIAFSLTSVLSNSAVIVPLVITRKRSHISISSVSSEEIMMIPIPFAASPEIVL